MSEFKFNLNNLEGFQDFYKRLKDSSHERAKQILKLLTPQEIEHVGRIVPVMDNSNNIYFAIDYDDEFITAADEILEIAKDTYTVSDESKLAPTTKDKIYTEMILGSGPGSDDDIGNLIKNIGFHKTVNRLFPELKKEILSIYNSKNYAQKLISSYEIIKRVNGRVRNNEIERVININKTMYENAKKAIEILKEKNSQIFNYDEIISLIDSEKTQEVQDKLENLKNPYAEDIEEISNMSTILMDMISNNNSIINLILINIEKFGIDSVQIVMKSIDNDTIREMVKKLLFELNIQFNPSMLTNEKIYKVWAEGDYIGNKFIVPIKNVTEIVVTKLIDEIYSLTNKEIYEFIEKLKHQISKSIVTSNGINENLINVILDRKLDFEFENEYINKYVANRIEEEKNKIKESIMAIKKNPDELKMFIEENQELADEGTVSKQEKKDITVITSDSQLIDSIIFLAENKDIKNYDVIKNSILSYSTEKGFMYIKNNIILNNILNAINSLDFKEIKRILKMNMSNEEKKIIEKIYRYVVKEKLK